METTAATLQALAELDWRPGTAELVELVPELVSMAMRGCRSDDETAADLDEVLHPELAEQYRTRAERLRAAAILLTDDLAALQAAEDTRQLVGRRAARAAALILLHARGEFPRDGSALLSRFSPATATKTANR